MNDFGFGTAFDTHLNCLLIHFLCISALHHCSFRASRVGLKQLKCIDIERDMRFSQEHQGSGRSLGSSFLLLHRLLDVFVVLLDELIPLELELGVIDMGVGLLSVGSLLHVLDGLISRSRGLEDVSVSDGDAQEVRPEGDDNDGEEELSEDVVLLLELEVALLGGAPAVVDGVLLVDPDEVDHGPDGDKGGRHDDHDAGAVESATGANAVLAEPDDEERGSDVGGHEQEDVHEREPPGDLIVEHEEELAGDLHGSEDKGGNTDGGDTGLDGDAAEAGDAVGSLVVAKANAAAALREDGLALLGVEGAEVLTVVSTVQPAGGAAHHVSHHSVVIVVSLLLGLFFRLLLLRLGLFLVHEVVLLLSGRVFVSFGHF